MWDNNNKQINKSIHLSPKVQYCGPRISAHASPTRWRAQFLFEKWFLLIKNDLESPLIFVLFLKGKQNKKENPKCDSLFGKGDLRKKSDRVWGSGYLSRRYDTDRSTFLSPKSRVSTNEMKLTSINMQVNGYSNQSCTHENQNIYKEWSRWGWMRT